MICALHATTLDLKLNNYNRIEVQTLRFNSRVEEKYMIKHVGNVAFFIQMLLISGAMDGVIEQINITLKKFFSRHFLIFC